MDSLSLKMLFPVHFSVRRDKVLPIQLVKSIHRSWWLIRIMYSKNMYPSPLFPKIERISQMRFKRKLVSQTLTCRIFLGKGPIKSIADQNFEFMTEWGVHYSTMLNHNSILYQTFCDLRPCFFSEILMMVKSDLYFKK